MDKPIAAAEANRQFSRILRDVQGGDSFVVTARGRPVARIVPVTDTDADGEAAHAELLRRATSHPAQNLPRWTRDELYDDDAQ
jgi:prevent-host-death family protein